MILRTFLDYGFRGRPPFSMLLHGSRSPGPSSPFVMLADNLIEPGQLVGIEDLPDPVAVLFTKSAELLVHLRFEHAMLLVILVHDAFKLADLRGREVEVVRQRFDHSLPVERGTPIPGPQG